VSEATEEQFIFFSSKKTRFRWFLVAVLIIAALVVAIVVVIFVGSLVLTLSTKTKVNFKILGRIHL